MPLSRKGAFIADQDTALFLLGRRRMRRRDRHGETGSPTRPRRERRFYLAGPRVGWRLCAIGEVATL